MRKNPSYRKAPLIVEGQAAFLRHSGYVRRFFNQAVPDAALSRRVEVQVLGQRSGPARLTGVNRALQATKRHLAFAPRCLTCYTERIQ